MQVSQPKIRRNDRCLCGSQKKYKHCCLSLETPDGTPIQKSERHLLDNTIKFLGLDVVSLSRKVSPIKMSVIILDLAQDLLAVANTTAQCNSAVDLTCLIWNMTVAHGPEDHDEKIELYTSHLETQEKKDEIRAAIHSIIKNKNAYYSKIKRIIIQHELIGRKPNLDINIISIGDETDCVN